MISILSNPSEKLLTTWYAENVVNGKTIASQKVTQACQRHLNDLDRQGTSVIAVEYLRNRHL